MTCAFAVRGALKKFPGVESVDVSLNQGVARVKLSPGNAVYVEQFWDAVRKNGFTPRQTHVVVHGAVLVTRGKLLLKVTGTSRSYELVSDPKNPRLIDQLKEQTTITLEGSMTPVKDPAKPLSIEVGGVQR